MKIHTEWRVNRVFCTSDRYTYTTLVNLHAATDGETQIIKSSCDLISYSATIFIFVDGSIYNLRKEKLGNKSICVFQSKMYY